MVGRRGIITLVVIVMMLLAGCAGKKKGPTGNNEPDGIIDPNNPDDPDNKLPEDPVYDGGFVSETGGYVEGADAAYYCQAYSDSTIKVDANRTFTGAKHSHDMWQGEESKVIFEGKLAPLGVGNWFFMPGAVVFAGASRAELKLEWDQAAANMDGLKVFLNLPKIKLNLTEDKAFDYVLKYGESGQTQGVNFTYEQNDPAHSERTTWTFRLNLHNPAKDAAGTYGTVTQGNERTIIDKLNVKVTWTIYRGYDCLPVDPAHYDGWVDRTSFTFLDMVTTHDTLAYAGGGTGLFYSFANANLLPGNSSIPPGTGMVRVTMDWQAADAPATLGLKYHGADQPQNSLTRVWEVPGPAESGTNHRVYEMQVHPAQTDSPYANKTRWDFTWYFDYDADNIDGTGKFKGTIHWVIDVFKLGFEP